MIAALRQEFNRRYRGETYRHLLDRMNAKTRTQLEIRVAETPVFLPAQLTQQMVDAGAAMTKQLVENKEYLRQAAQTIPTAYRVANQDAHPHFMTVDFGLVHGGGGPWQGDWRTLEPRLVELQAFPSVYGYQALLTEEYRRIFDLDVRLRAYLNGHTDESYWERMRRVVVGSHAPENVILMEVTPGQQKTLPDFHIHEDRLGIRTVDISTVRQRGRQLFYDRDGTETPIRRIYNRAIVDEMIRKQVKPGFNLTADLDVEWAGHPNWYFLISKFALPYLTHASVPPAVFLSDWMQGKGQERLFADRSQWVLKPLFSFAGKGIQFAPDAQLLESIPPAERASHLLQQRVHFTPTVDTPFGMTQAEVRIMYVWPDGGELEAVQTLLRLGRGMMMGVDHNNNQEWVGGSAGLVYFP